MRQKAQTRIDIPKRLDAEHNIRISSRCCFSLINAFIYIYKTGYSFILTIIFFHRRFPNVSK